jgi:internalin A
MKTKVLLALACSLGALACEENKYDSILAKEASTEAPLAAPVEAAPPPAPAATPAATATWTKKSAADCKPHPATIDFEGDSVLEAEVRRKVGKDKGPITPADLAQVKSLNLTAGHPHQIDPCIFPMFTSLKDLFLGPGEYDDLTPLQKLPLEALVAASSPIKDLHPIEGMKRLDRLDLSHTLIDDTSLKAVAGLVNLTELMLDEDAISDLSPIGGLQKLQRLSIKSTQVKSLQPIAGIRTLKFLYIANTPISDISPVQGLISGGMKLVQK